MIAVAEFNGSGHRTGSAHRSQGRDPDRLVTMSPDGRILTDRNGRRNRQEWITKCGLRIDAGFPFEVGPMTERRCGHCFPSLSA